ncbi:MAG: hypothetical protein Q7P63_01070 [Verrucomicrobiota bacterium JB022]|nr:hypothetical protein [Verrucomicrobiota bacterium JB022]
MAQVIPTRIKFLRRTATELDAIAAEAVEPALETDTGNVRLSDAAGAWSYYLLAIPAAGLTDGDHFQWNGTQLERVPRGPAVADVDTTDLPAAGVIGALPVSDPPTQAEVQSLRDECEHLRTALAEAIGTIHALRDRLQAAGIIG